jgi:hypothetical protein
MTDSCLFKVHLELWQNLVEVAHEIESASDRMLKSKCVNAPSAIRRRKHDWFWVAIGLPNDTSARAVRGHYVGISPRHGLTGIGVRVSDYAKREAVDLRALEQGKAMIGRSVFRQGDPRREPRVSRLGCGISDRSHWRKKFSNHVSRDA